MSRSLGPIPLTSAQRNQRNLDATKFGNRIREYRIKEGLSCAVAAHESNISIASWMNMEHGHTNLLAAYRKALEDFQAITSTLGITLNDLTKPLTPSEDI